MLPSLMGSRPISEVTILKVNEIKEIMGTHKLKTTRRKDFQWWFPFLQLTNQPLTPSSWVLVKERNEMKGKYRNKRNVGKRKEILYWYSWVRKREKGN